MIENLSAVADAIVKVALALGVLFGVLANVLPEGRVKTFCSFAGIRIFKGIAVYKRLAPKTSDDEEKKS